MKISYKKSTKINFIYFIFVRTKFEKFTTYA
jgi:hypothetical protein